MKAVLVDKHEEAPNTFSFVFKPEAPLHFSAGQYMYLTLPSLAYPDARGDTRHFTISSSPHTPDLFSITTKIREESGFKQTLAQLPLGTTLEAKGPQGTFIFEPGDVALPHLFIAGGIGITPFMSMLRYLHDTNFYPTITLLYSCSTPNEIVFNQELTKLTALNTNFKLLITITNPDTNHTLPWKGLVGRVDISKIKMALNPLGKCAKIWVCGPPAMIDATEAILATMTIDEGLISTEKFIGY